MSEGNILQAPALECSCIMYRAARKRWVQQVERSDVILPDAFLLRAQESGLSVRPARRVSPGQCAAGLAGCTRVLSLHVGRVRNIGLQVVADAEDHAEIQGLPHRSENAAEAERLASLLAVQARIIRVA